VLSLSWQMLGDFRGYSAMVSSLLFSLTFMFGMAWGQSPSNPQGQSEEYRAKYQQLVEQAKKGEPVDFVELIATASDWETSSKTIIKAPERDEMVAAFKAKKFKKAVELAEAVLNYEYTNRSLHRATAKAYRELKNPEQADFHTKIGEQILNALLSTGDGQTAETAYCVQGINEEYVIMSHFGYKVSSQAFVSSTNSNYDVLSGTHEKTGKRVDLYFDISGFFRRCVESHRVKKN
jgi:hypothetical protein